LNLLGLYSQPLAANVLAELQFYTPLLAAGYKIVLITKPKGFLKKSPHLKIPPTPFAKGGRGDFAPHGMAQRATAGFQREADLHISCNSAGENNRRRGGVDHGRDVVEAFR
jgi:hypothetical protein